MSHNLPRSLTNDIDIPKLEDLAPGKRTSGQTAFTLLSGIASIIGLYGFYDVVIKNSYGEVLKGHEGFILSVVSLLAFASYAFVIFYAYNQRFIIEEKVTTLYRAYALLFTKQYKVFHIVSVFSAVLQELRSISVTKVGMQAYDDIEPGEIQTGIQDLVDRTATIFRQICSKNCAVTVKRIVRVSGSSETIRVETMTRDATSNHERGFVDTIPSISNFDHTSNTAFRVIVDPASPDNYFLCNDLKQLAGEGHYQNSNPFWSKSYNACLVVPICDPNATPITEGIFGFMCVDSLEGSFDDDISLQILRVVSNLLYEYLLLIEKLDPEDGKPLAAVADQQQTAPTTGTTPPPAPSAGQRPNPPKV